MNFTQRNMLIGRKRDILHIGGVPSVPTLNSANGQEFLS